MSKKNQPPSRAEISSALYLSPEEDNFCKLLEKKFGEHGDIIWKINPADMFRGAIFALKKENNSNPEQLVQAAHSLREIFHPIRTKGEYQKIIIKSLKSNKDSPEGELDLTLIRDTYNDLSNYAHHFNNVKKDIKIFYDRNGFYDNIVVKLISDGLKIFNKTGVFYYFKKIDNLIEKRNKAKEDKKIMEEIRELINANSVMLHYFFKKIDDTWISPLLKSGFLKFKKNENEEIDSRGDWIFEAELFYLEKIAEKKPKEVADIICEATISKNNSNFNLINRFLSITELLPIEQIIKIIKKNNTEKWVEINKNNHYFYYEKIIFKLNEFKKYDDLLILAENLISFKVNVNQKKYNDYHFLMDKIKFNLERLPIEFFLEFSKLNEIEYQKKALKILTSKLSEILKSTDFVPDVKSFFKNFGGDHFFGDVDFFTSNLKKISNSETNRIVWNIAGTIIELSKKIISSDLENDNYVIDECIGKMINSKVVWRLKLFILSSFKEKFKNQLKEAFFKIFEAIDNKKKYLQIKSGAEYETALEKTFSFFENCWKKEFIEKIFKYFGNYEMEEDESEKLTFKRTGWRLLSLISESLTENQKKKCEAVFKKECIKKYVPSPALSITWTEVKKTSSIATNDLSLLSIVKIVENLKTIWSPIFLSKKNEKKIIFDIIDFGNELENDIANRLNEYLDNAELFFEREKLDEHYTYIFFKVIANSLTKKKLKLKENNLKGLLNLMETITKSGTIKEFENERNKYDSINDYGAMSWKFTLRSMIELLKKIFNIKIFKFSDFREKNLKIIKYLLSFPDPKFKFKLMESQNQYGNEAINSVRGEAFEIFTTFMERDSFQKKNIGEDVKNIFEAFLKDEQTGSIMILIGQFFSSIYSWDKTWSIKLFFLFFHLKKIKF